MKKQIEIPENLRLANMNDFKDGQGGRKLMMDYWLLTPTDDFRALWIDEQTDPHELAWQINQERIYINRTNVS